MTTIKSTFRNTARTLVAIAAGALIAIPLAVTFAPTITETPTSAPSTPPSRAAVLLARHDCWIGTAPAGAVAGRVVVTRGDSTFIGGQRVTDQALDQIFNGGDYNLTVHGFCEAAR